jgi:hypothetical protein
MVKPTLTSSGNPLISFGHQIRPAWTARPKAPVYTAPRIGDNQPEPARR